MSHNLNIAKTDDGYVRLTISNLESGQGHFIDLTLDNAEIAGNTILKMAAEISEEEDAK